MSIDWGETANLFAINRVVVRGRPRCAVCNKPVEEISVTDDDFMRRRRVRVRCHGASEVVDIQHEELSEDGMQWGDAFVPPQEPRRLGP